jgi:hypothetical protein
MPENDKADTNTQQPKQANRNAFKAAYAQYKFLPIGLRRILKAITAGLVVLLIVSVFMPHLAERVKFFTASSLNLFLLFAVIVQAYIYRRQWEVMEDQWKAVKDQAEIMRKQARSMDESVVFGLRAHVGVGSFKFDLDRKRVFIEIENIGKVPAKDIKLEVILSVEIPQEFISRIPVAQKVERPFQFMQIDTGAEYGGTKLFPGSLPITFVVHLDNDLLDNDQYGLITAGHAKVVVNGLITFHDGFNSGKKTPFSFRYFLKDNLWSPSPVPDLEGGETDREKQKTASVKTVRFK